MVRLRRHKVAEGQHLAELYMRIAANCRKHGLTYSTGTTLIMYACCKYDAADLSPPFATLVDGPDEVVDNLPIASGKHHFAQGREVEARIDRAQNRFVVLATPAFCFLYLPSGLENVPVDPFRVFMVFAELGVHRNDGTIDVAA